MRAGAAVDARAEAGALRGRAEEEGRLECDGCREGAFDEGADDAAVRVVEGEVGVEGGVEVALVEEGVGLRAGHIAFEGEIMEKG